MDKHILIIELEKHTCISEISQQLGLTLAALGKLRHIFKNKQIPIHLKQSLRYVVTYGLTMATITKQILGIKSVAMVLLKSLKRQDLG